jgi:hypothetical protein
VEEENRKHRRMDGTGLALCSLLSGVSQANHAELHFGVGLDDRSVGRLGLRSRRGYPSRGSRGVQYRGRNRLGRRGALAFFFAIMAVSIPLAFGYTFYPGHGGLSAFIPCLFFVGVGGGSFSVQLLWLPEQYRSECRGSALAFATCVGRFVAAGATLIVGAGIAHYKSIGVPVALSALAFVFGPLPI